MSKRRSTYQKPTPTLHGLFGDAPANAPKPTATDLLVTSSAVIAIVVATIAAAWMLTNLAVAVHTALMPLQQLPTL